MHLIPELQNTKQNFMEPKEFKKYTIILGDFKTLFSGINKSNKQITATDWHL